MKFGNRIVTDGLVFAVDAANPISYPGSGTAWNDLTPNKNNGTLINGPTFSSANAGSIVFDGVNDRVQTINNTGISGINARSLCIWVYPTELTTDKFYSPLRIGTTSIAQLFEILLRNNTIFGHFYGGGQTYSVSSDKTLLNNYSHIVMTYSNPNVKIYVDGELKGTSGSFTLNTSNTILSSGNPAYGGHDYYEGRIPNIQLYNRALSASEVLQNYNALKGRFGL